MNKKVVTRIPPSPTGNLHLGTARTALFNYLYAKQNNGKVILRLEDTDKERSKDEFTENIKQGLAWLGITYDEKFKQSERADVYKKYIEKLIQEDKAYISKEEEGERSEVIRFRNPNKVVKFSDEIRGDIEFNTTELGDFVIAKSLDEPLYHLAVVIDDHEMEITHILRGEDLISSTPRQILLQEAIGAKRPIYAHLPLLLGKDKSKLSKRHGAKSISEFKNEGFLPESLINYLAFLGWNPGTEQEFFTFDELVEAFSLKQIQKGGAVFAPEKLEWYNKHYLNKLTDDEACIILKEKLPGFGECLDLLKLKPVVFERITKLSDIDKMVEDKELDFFIREPEYDLEKVVWKDSDKTETIEHLNHIVNELKSNNFDSPESVKNIIWPYADEKGRGNVLWPLRYLLSGKEKSPDPFTIVSILGKEESINRIENAIKKLS